MEIVIRERAHLHQWNRLWGEVCHLPPHTFAYAQKHQILHVAVDTTQEDPDLGTKVRRILLVRTCWQIPKWCLLQVPWLWHVCHIWCTSYAHGSLSLKCCILERIDCKICPKYARSGSFGIILVDAKFTTSSLGMHCLRCSMFAILSLGIQWLLDMPNMGRAKKLQPIFNNWCG